MLSEKFFTLLRRKNYVTPTSYLELIMTFKNLLEIKKDEVRTLQNRYLNGLEKLSFAASQVYTHGHDVYQSLLEVSFSNDPSPPFISKVFFS